MLELLFYEQCFRKYTIYMTGWALQSPQKTSHISMIYPTEKQTRNLSQEFSAGYLLPKIVRNLHKILMRGSKSIFQRDILQICVRSSTETAGSLRNPRDPAYPVASYGECSKVVNATGYSSRDRAFKPCQYSWTPYTLSNACEI